jgi:5'-deoxynucleotidase YfbR-like HD superfamily hydrolase
VRDHQQRAASHDAAVAALFAWRLTDPEDHAEFARNNDYVRDLAAAAGPFFGELHLDQLRAELAAGAAAAAGWSDWRALCEARAREVLLRPPVHRP